MTDTCHISKQIADYAVELAWLENEAEHREYVRQQLIEKYTKKISLNIETRDLDAIHVIFDEHHQCFQSWLAEMLADIASDQGHDVYQRLILGDGRDDAGHVAKIMAYFLNYEDEIETLIKSGEF